MRSHAPLRGNTQKSMIRFIRRAREATNKFNKRKFDGVRDQVSHREHWDRGEHHGHRNSEAQNGRYLVADVVESETGITAEAAVCEGAMVQTPTPSPPTKTDRKLRAADRPVAKGVGQRRWNDGLGGWGNIREVSHRRPHEKGKHL